MTDVDPDEALDILQRKSYVAGINRAPDDSIAFDVPRDLPRDHRGDIAADLSLDAGYVMEEAAAGEKSRERDAFVAIPGHGGQGLLRADPGLDVIVRNDRTDEQVIATADGDGIVRTETGAAFSRGAYSIVGEADDAA